MSKRIYAPTYVGVLVSHSNPDWWDNHSVDDVTKDLLSKGLPGLVMKSGGPLGVTVASRMYVFRYPTMPTAKEFPYFAYVIGPFRTARAAHFMAEYGHNNVHCQTVCDAEKLTKNILMSKGE